MPSAINGAIPATNAALVSAPVRTNFATAQTEISAIQAQLGTTGPYLAVGVPQPSPAPLAGTVTANQVSVSADGTGAAIIGMNLYVDGSGGEHYLANGAAALIQTHPSITGGYPALSFGVFDFNTSGPNAPAASVGSLQLVYSAGGMNPGGIAVVGRGNETPTVLPRRGTLLAGDLSARADPIDPSQSPRDNVSRLGLNAYADNSASGNWIYAAAGPGGTVTVHSANAGAFPMTAASMRISVSDEGAAGASLENSPKFVVFGIAGTTANHTNVSLLVNTTGTPTLYPVQVGAANSGGTGFRTLVVQVP